MNFSLAYSRSGRTDHNLPKDLMELIREIGYHTLPKLKINSTTILCLYIYAVSLTYPPFATNFSLNKSPGGSEVTSFPRPDTAPQKFGKII